MEGTWWTQPEELDEEQRNIVSLGPTGNHLIVGPPGSGKTNLLLLRGSYLQKSGKQNVVLLTFNRTLREFLATGTAASPFDPEKIRTYRSWALELLKQCGRSVPDLDGDFDVTRQNIAAALSSFSTSEIQDHQFDAILLDEAQDYSSQEIQIIARHAKTLFAAGDDRQRIYAANGGIAALEQLCGTAKTLSHNYRNGLAICRVADAIRGELDDDAGLESCSNYNEEKYPSSVFVLSGAPIDDQIAKCFEQIETQLVAYPSGLIGVIAPLKITVQRVAEALEVSKFAEMYQLQLFDAGYQALSPDRRIFVSTIHGAKGLEFRALHLVGMDGIKKHYRNQRKLAYTAVTRAKTSLSVYHDGSLPGYLEQALQAADGNVVAPPHLNDLFR